MLSRKEYLKQYNIKNREKKRLYMKKYNKKYYQENKEKLLHKDKIIRDCKYICICDSKITKKKCNIIKHLKTNKHKKFMINLKHNLNID